MSTRPFRKHPTFVAAFGIALQLGASSAGAADASTPVATCDAPGVPSAAKCAPGEDKAFEKYVHDMILGAARSGMRPVVKYAGPDSAAAAGALEKEAAHRAQVVTAAIFGAIRQPESSVEQAATAVFKDKAQRESFSYLHTCEAQGNRIFDPQRDGVVCPKGWATPPFSSSADMEIQRVYGSDLPAAEAAQTFVRTQLYPSSRHDVKLCNGGACQSRAITEKQVAGMNFPVTAESAGAPKYTELLDTTVLDPESKPIVGVPTMYNAYKVAVVEKSVCGGKVYVVPQFLTRSDYGLSRASVITAVLPTGKDKSLVVGSADVQAFQKDPNIGGEHKETTDSFMLYTAFKLDVLKPLVVTDGSKLYRGALKVSEPIVNGRAVASSAAAAAKAAAAPNACQLPVNAPSKAVDELGMRLDDIRRAASELK